MLNACVNAGLSLESEEGGNEDMCRGIQGLVEEGRAEGRAEERVLVLTELVKDGLISSEEGAKRAGKTEEEFLTLLKETREKVK